jgi:hypothetical protein
MFAGWFQANHLLFDEVISRATLIGNGGLIAPADALSLMTGYGPQAKPLRVDFHF